METTEKYSAATENDEMNLAAIFWINKDKFNDLLEREHNQKNHKQPFSASLLN
jgi:hypothetical protein